MSGRGVVAMGALHRDGRRGSARGNGNENERGGVRSKQELRGQDWGSVLRMRLVR